MKAQNHNFCKYPLQRQQWPCDLSGSRTWCQAHHEPRRRPAAAGASGQNLVQIQPAASSSAVQRTNFGPTPRRQPVIPRASGGLGQRDLSDDDRGDNGMPLEPDGIRPSPDSRNDGLGVQRRPAPRRRPPVGVDWAESFAIARTPSNQQWISGVAGGVGREGGGGRHAGDE